MDALPLLTEEWVEREEGWWGLRARDAVTPPPSPPQPPPQPALRPRADELADARDAAARYADAVTLLREARAR